MSNNSLPTEHRRRLEAFVADFRASPYGFGEDGGPLAITPSPIDGAMVEDHEKLLGTNLPPLFRAYLRSWCLPGTDLYVGQLPAILPGRPFLWVERWSIAKMDQPFYRRNERLVPFTHGPADCSDLCFDVFRADDSGDFPIIKVWHGGMDAWAFAWSDADCERAQVFRHFSGYLDFLNAWLIYRSAPQDVRFEDWLQNRGMDGPTGYYDAIG